MAIRALVVALLTAGTSASLPEALHDDKVNILPGYGEPRTKHFTGFADAIPSGQNKLFYYFVEADIGSHSAETPVLIWLNGGPGASSLIGLFAENLGPQKITENGTLIDNPDSITKKYHLMAIDNPVGSGYSYTKTGAYVKTEEEVRTQFVHALRQFYKKHPEYAQNPLWLTGESYAGKYVPNIGYELAVNAPEIPFQGIVVGNGLYNGTAQYSTVGEMAFGAGIIDENTLAEEKVREGQCLAAISEKRPKAGDYCENITVRWLYTSPQAAAGKMFYYDFGMSNADEFDAITGAIGKYLNNAEVKRALHVPSNVTWECNDEVGPVAEALAEDFAVHSITVVAALLEKGKHVTLYNGVRDGSVCNHIGNLKALLAMQWSGAEGFARAPNTPWPSASKVMGHIRSVGKLSYMTVLRTGHLVPTAVPDSFATLLDMAVKPSMPSSRSSDAAVMV